MFTSFPKRLLVLAVQITVTFTVFCAGLDTVYAELQSKTKSMGIDRITLVTVQIGLLKNREQQGLQELASLRKHEVQISEKAMEKAGKRLLDKANLDITVSKSNLDSINIELTDSSQSMIWLEKNIQEIENQLNLAGIFGSKITHHVVPNLKELHTDLEYQQKLLALEKERVQCLLRLQNSTQQILQLKNERANQLSIMLKSHKMISIKQQQARDELLYQESQNYWLTELNSLYAKLAMIDPTQKQAYVAIERDIFYANENANFAYNQSLRARYQDQIQQMQLAAAESNSISVLNKIDNQVKILANQIDKLEYILKTRIAALYKHIISLSQQKKNDSDFKSYLEKLHAVHKKYQELALRLTNLSQELSDFRSNLAKEIQEELSSRQGFPSFGTKMLIDLGKEILLVPALTFQMIKSLSNNLVKAFEQTGPFYLSLLLIVEMSILTAYLFLRRWLTRVLLRPSLWRDKINSKWLSLQFLSRNFAWLALMINVTGLLFYFNIPLQNFICFVYLSLVWLVFRTIRTASRICLVESLHDTTDHGVRLYHRLKWIIFAGGLITGLTVFLHQLPLIYELSALFDRLFLFCVMLVSLLLLRSWQVVPNLILSNMDAHHPYIQKSMRLVGILIPTLMFGNSLIGLFGFLNLVMTILWYEGIFLLVLMMYLIVRGLLSDGMEQLSRLMITHVNNGWLFTEAFLKPIDKVLRLSLFISGWSLLFVLYKWDKQSPIVARMTQLLHYHLASILNSAITPLSIIKLAVVVAIFYWTARWTREFVYRLLLSRTHDMGIRNSIAILSQYSVIITGVLLCLKVMGIDFQALTYIAGMFAIGIGFGLRDLVNNFVCGFLILLERPLRVGDIVEINGIEGDVINIGSRAVTVRTWDHMDLVVPNTEVFNKTFINWTAKDNIVRSVLLIKTSRDDSPHKVRLIIQHVLSSHKDVLKDPAPEVFLKEMNDIFIQFELRYYVNIRKVQSRPSVVSDVLTQIWDQFAAHGIRHPYPEQQLYIRTEEQVAHLLGKDDEANPQNAPL